MQPTPATTGAFVPRLPEVPNPIPPALYSPSGLVPEPSHKRGPASPKGADPVRTWSPPPQEQPAVSFIREDLAAKAKLVADIVSDDDDDADYDDSLLHESSSDDDYNEYRDAYKTKGPAYRRDDDDF